MDKVVISIIVAIFSASVFATEKLQSPDGTITVMVDVEGEKPIWSVERKGTQILKPSALGLDFIWDRWEKFTLKNLSRRNINSIWKTKLYKKETIIDKANEMELELADSKGRLMNIIFRAYNEGVAFRYVIPKQKTFDGFQLCGELTEWCFAEGAEGWFTSYKSFNTSQEEDFNHRKISEIDEKEIIGMPAIIEIGNQRVALCEADLTNWAGLFFRAKKDENDASKLSAILAPLPPSNAICADNVAVIRATPAMSPWRVMICADSDIDLINRNDIILNLNPEADPTIDFSWVKSGASSWDWWVESNNSLSTDLTISLVDFASEMGWSYHTIDGGWYGWARRPNHGPDIPIDIRKGFDLHKIIAHANKKNVGIWVWLHWEALDDNGVEETFAKFEKWGVKGVKIDFLDRSDQKIVRWYESTVRAAAKHKLLINYHGAYKPTGMNRTWPNQITREGIRGNEYMKFDGKVTAKHTATLPYTRFLLGPGDFTPGGFGNVHSEQFEPQCKRGHRYGDENDHREIWAEEIGTRAHALALCVAYDSPLMTLCDWPKRYRGAKGVEVLRSLPAEWKNTIPISGNIGKSYVVARESFDGTFYVAGIGVEPMRTELSFSFLPDGEWECSLYTDGPNADKDAKDLSESKFIVTRDKKIFVPLAREGGFVAKVICKSNASSRH